MESIEQVQDRIEKLQSDIDDKRAEIDAFEVSDYVSESDYDDMLDECYPEVECAGLTFNPSRILAELDPVAYRCGYNDYCDSIDPETISEYGDLHDELEELEDELMDTESELEQLESESE